MPFLHFFAQLCADTTFQAAALGTIAPVVHKYLVSDGIVLSRRQNVAIAVAVCALIASIPIAEKAIAAGSATPDDFMKAAMAAFASGQILFQTYFRAKFDAAPPVEVPVATPPSA